MFLALLSSKTKIENKFYDQHILKGVERQNKEDALLS